MAVPDIGLEAGDKSFQRVKKKKKRGREREREKEDSTILYKPTMKNVTPLQLRSFVYLNSAFFNAPICETVWALHPMSSVVEVVLTNLYLMV